ncbi:MAG: HepT-like ribonuclease domain-containing protein [Planctomycetota bacterium]
MDRDQTYLLDILEAARLAIFYVGNKSENEFLADIQCQDSVIRRLEIIGEAARRVSNEFRLVHPELPWSDMIGMRNILIHEYDDVDIHIVW